MPTILKIILALGVLWSSVYSASYAAYQFKNKKHKSGIATLVLVVIMVSTFIYSLFLIPH